MIGGCYRAPLLASPGTPCVFPRRKGDMKQLPPATGEAPFIVDKRVPSLFEFRCFGQNMQGGGAVCARVGRGFSRRCLRENRRVVQDASRQAELESFHEVLTDISQGFATVDGGGDKVRRRLRFVVFCSCLVLIGVMRCGPS